MTDDRIRELVGRLAASAPPAPPLPQEIRRSHRSRQRVVLGATVGIICILVIASILPTPIHRVVLDSLGARIAVCPGQTDLDDPHTQMWLRYPNADGLPGEGTTTLDRVREAIRTGRSYIEDHYPGASISTGKGWGVTFSGDNRSRIVIHHAPDSQAVVTLHRRDQCPIGPAANLFLDTPKGRGVPVLFRYRLRDGEAPAGTSLVYASGDEIAAVDIRTRARRVLASGGICGDAGIAVDTVHQRLGFCSGGKSNHVMTFDTRTGQKTDLGPQYGWSPAAWTNDGHLVMLHFAHNRWSELVEVTGRARRLLYRSDRSIEAIVTMADDTLAVMEYQKTAENQRLVLVGTPHGRVTVLSQGWSYPLAAFGSGHDLLYEKGSQNTGLVIARVDGERIAQDDTGVHGSFNSAAVGSNDLIALAGAGGTFDSRIYLFRAMTKELSFLTNGLGPILWEPDNWIVYMRRGEIRETDPDGHTRLLVRGNNLRPIAVFTR
jgi:hypothetical protein